MGPRSEEESFECGVCLLDVRDIPFTHIWQCSEGHIQCHACYIERGGASAVSRDTPCSDVPLRGL